MVELCGWVCNSSGNSSYNFFVRTCIASFLWAHLENNGRKKADHLARFNSFLNFKLPYKDALKAA